MLSLAVLWREGGQDYRLPGVRSSLLYTTVLPWIMDAGGLTTFFTFYVYDLASPQTSSGGLQPPENGQAADQGGMSEGATALFWLLVRS